MIIKFIKYKIKQVFCKHLYIQRCKFYGRNIEHDKEVIFDYDFEYGKHVVIEMDEDSQLNLKGE